MSETVLNAAQPAAQTSNLRTFAARGYPFVLPFVGLITALLIFPGPFTVVGMVGVLFFLAFRWLASGQPFPKTAINPLLLAFLVLFAFGLVISPSPDTAWRVASHTLAGIIVLVSILDRGQTNRQLLAATGVMVLVGALFAVGAPFGANWADSKGLSLTQWMTHIAPVLASPSNVNNVAGALEAAVPLALALIAANQKPWRMVGTLALAPLMVMLLLLQSRGAWLAVLLGLAVYATLYRRWVLPLVPVVLLAGLWLNNVFGDPLPTRAIESDSHEVTTAGDRISIWQEGTRLLLRSPLVGIGVNGFAAYGAPKVGVGTGVYVMRGTHAHNLFLEVALDTGILGGAAFVGMLALAFGAAFDVYRRAGAGTRERALAIGVCAASVVIVTHGMFDTIFWGFKAGIFLWGTVGLALGLNETNKAIRR